MHIISKNGRGCLFGGLGSSISGGTSNVLENLSHLLVKCLGVIMHSVPGMA